MGKSAVVGYPSDVTDDAWEFVWPYVLLRREDSPQCWHDLRRVFNGVRYAARTGGQWPYPGHLLALTVIPTDQGDREKFAALAEQVQEVTGSRWSWPTWTRLYQTERSRSCRQAP